MRITETRTVITCDRCKHELTDVEVQIVHVGNDWCEGEYEPDKTFELCMTCLSLFTDEFMRTL